jgi:hypothetical protein
LFRDGSCGFSVKRRYPQDGGFKPAKTQEGLDDTVALLKVVAYPSGEENTPKGVPLSVTVRQFSVFLNNHFDYSDTDPLSPTKSERERSRVSIQPLSVDFDDDYFINLDSGTLFRPDGTPVLPMQLLDEVFQMHLAPTMPVRGVSVRLRRAAHGIALLGIERLEPLVKWLMHKLLGVVLIEPSDYFSGLRGYRKEHLRLTSDDSLEMFGYRASRRAIVALALFGMAVALGVYNKYLPKRVADILDNNFFSVCFVVVSLFILDVVFPRMALWFLNAVITVKKWLLFRHYRVKKCLGFYI